MSKNYGIKSSQEGQDIFSFTLDKSTVTSQYANHKLQLNQSPAHIDTLTYTFTSEPGNGTTTLFTKAHGYSYTPAHWTMLDVLGVYDGGSGTWAFCPYYVFDTVVSPPDFVPTLVEDIIYAYTDSTNLYIKLERANVAKNPNTLNGTTLDFKYMIFAENGS